jgi:hypothetical protein
MRFSLIKISHLLVLVTAILIIAMVVYMNWLVYSVPGGFTLRCGPFQANPELRKPILAISEILFVLLKIQIVLIWLSIFIILFVNDTFESGRVPPLFVNIFVHIFLTGIVLLLYMYTALIIPCECCYCC